MVMLFEAHVAVIPVGKPVAVPIPVAPVVVWVMFVRGVLMHKVGVDEAAPTVLIGVGVNVPELVAVPPAVVTVMFPAVFPVGIIAVIWLVLSTVYPAEIPLKLTSVTFAKLVPVITKLFPGQFVVAGVKLVMVGIRYPVSVALSKI